MPVLGWTIQLVRDRIVPDRINLIKSA
jgi:hypothetical protein